MNALIGDIGNTTTKICLIEIKTFKVKKVIYFKNRGFQGLNFLKNIDIKAYFLKNIEISLYCFNTTTYFHKSSCCPESIPKLPASRILLKSEFFILGDFHRLRIENKR